MCSNFGKTTVVLIAYLIFSNGKKLKIKFAFTGSAGRGVTDAKNLNRFDTAIITVGLSSDRVEKRTGIHCYAGNVYAPRISNPGQSEQLDISFRC